MKVPTLKFTVPKALPKAWGGSIKLEALAEKLKNGKGAIGGFKVLKIRKFQHQRAGRTVGKEPPTDYIPDADSKLEPGCSASSCTVLTSSNCVAPKLATLKQI